MRPEDVGGVHINYLDHCHRQLWLYLRGIRPEYLSATVALGEAVHDVSYPRATPVDLGAACLDHVDGATLGTRGQALVSDHRCGFGAGSALLLSTTPAWHRCPRCRSALS
jgi:hypothetical protein